MGGDATRRHEWLGWTLAIVLIMLGPPATADARPGDLDPTFGSGGKVTTDIVDYYPSNAITQLMRDDQGRIIAGGIGAGNGLLVRYHADGSLDPTFGTGGIALDPRLYYRHLPPYARAYDGRFYAGGFTPDEESAILLRYDSEGRPDPSFGTDGLLTLDFESSQLVPLPEGPLLIAGACRWPASGPGLVRLLADGTPDPGFSASCHRYTNGRFHTLRFPTPGTIVAAGIAEPAYGEFLDRVVIGHTHRGT